MLSNSLRYTAHVRVFNSEISQPETRLQHCLKISQPIVDLIVALVSVPLLVTFTLLLQTQLQINAITNDHNNVSADIDPDWNQDTETRWTVLALGLAMLTVSLLVCCYIMKRLGLCSREKHEIHCYEDECPQDNMMRPELLITQNNNLRAVNTILQQYIEQPPSYESVVCYDLPPPPYCAITMHLDNKIADVHKSLQDTG